MGWKERAANINEGHWRGIRESMNDNRDLHCDFATFPHNSSFYPETDRRRFPVCPASNAEESSSDVKQHHTLCLFNGGLDGGDSLRLD